LSGIIAATIAVAAISAYGAMRSAKAQKDQADFTSAVERNRATRERQQAAIDSQEFARDQSRVAAARRAIQGGSGTEIGEGSNLLTTEDFAGEVAFQRRRIEEGGEVRATRLEQSATLNQMAGKNAQTAGYIKAGSSLLSGGAKAYDRSKA
jgi:hypothetical protein